MPDFARLSQIILFVKKLSTKRSYRAKPMKTSSKTSVVSNMCSERGEQTEKIVSMQKIMENGDVSSSKPDVYGFFFPNVFIDMFFLNL